MIVDGIGSMIGAGFGSPYGTTVYIGHVAYKKMGATRGYSFLNGFLWLIIGVFGIHAVLDAIVPHEIVSGIIVVIGFCMAAQAMESVPERWYPAVLFGICVCFSDYMLAGGMANQDIKFLGNGYIFVSLLYTFFLMMLTDRWFLAAAGVFMALLVFSFFGITHGALVEVRYNKYGTLVGSEWAGDASGMPGWKFILMYGLSAVLCLAFHVAQRQGFIEAPEVEDFREIQSRELRLLKGHTISEKASVANADTKAAGDSADAKMAADSADVEKATNSV